MEKARKAKGRVPLVTRLSSHGAFTTNICRRRRQTLNANKRMHLRATDTTFIIELWTVYLCSRGKETASLHLTSTKLKTAA